MKPHIIYTKDWIVKEISKMDQQTLAFPKLVFCCIQSAFSNSLCQVARSCAVAFQFILTMSLALFDTQFSHLSWGRFFVQVLWKFPSWSLVCSCHSPYWHVWPTAGDQADDLIYLSKHHVFCLLPELTSPNRAMNSQKNFIIEEFIAALVRINDCGICEEVL